MQRNIFVLYFSNDFMFFFIMKVNILIIREIILWRDSWVKFENKNLIITK